MNLKDWVANPQSRMAVYGTLGVVGLLSLVLPGAILPLGARMALLLVVTVVGAAFTELCAQHDGVVPSLWDVLNANLTFNGIVALVLMLWWGFTTGLWTGAAVTAIFVMLVFTAADVVPRSVVRRFVK